MILRPPQVLHERGVEQGRGGGAAPIATQAAMDWGLLPAVAACCWPEAS